MAAPSTDWSNPTRNSTSWSGASINSTSWAIEDLIPSSGYLLSETGDAFLMENSDFLLFE